MSTQKKKTTPPKKVIIKPKNGQSHIIHKDASARLIISYSEARAKKDKANRERGLQKLEKQIRTGKLTKANINNKGYNKYLKIEGD